MMKYYMAANKEDAKANFLEFLDIKYQALVGGECKSNNPIKQSIRQAIKQSINMQGMCTYLGLSCFGDGLEFNVIRTVTYLEYKRMKPQMFR